ENVIAWLDSNIATLKQTAGWVVGHHPEWGGALASFFQARLAAKSSGDADRAELQNQLAQLAKAAAIQEVLAATVSDSNAPQGAQLVSLRAMAASGLKEAPPAWLSALATLLARNDAALTAQAVATARVLPLPKTGGAEFSG